MKRNTDGEHLNSHSTDNAAVSQKTALGQKNEGSKLTAIAIIAHLTLIGACFFSNYRTAKPLAAHCPAEQFSEGRAMATVEDLANGFPQRNVGRTDYHDAADYLLRRASSIQELASGRADISVEVVKEQATGAVDMHFMHEEITNAYINVTNVVLKITPKDAADAPAVLINGHFDSTLGSPGASDCASCVAVALELARLVLADRRTKLATPLVFLLNGGEEAFLLGAHAFTSRSRHRGGIGAFVNLESTGAGGPDIIFQHSGAWTLEAYAQAARRPRGTIIAQDFFEAEILPADTDFRMLSASYQGELPGIDLALLLDSQAYHMDVDVPERIRPGTLQAMGENVQGLILEYGRVLHAQTDAAATTGKLIFFDVLGLFMVRYPVWLAAYLHRIPFSLALGLPLLLPLAAGPSGKQASLPVKYGRLLREACAALLGALGAVLLPALYSAALVIATGQPMAWMAHSWAAYAFYLPVALAGLLLPQLATAQGAAEPRWALAGFSAAWGAAAELLTLAGLGSGYVAALWAACAQAACLLLPPEQGRRGAQLLRGFLAAAPAALASAPPALLLSAHVVQKGSNSGAVLGRFGVDVKVAVVVGLAALGLAGFLAPLAARLHPRRARVAVTLACLASAAFAAGWSLSMQPYSEAAPKKLYLFRTQQLSADQQRAERRSWDVFALDTAPVQAALPAALARLPQRPLRADDMLALFPANNFMQGVSLQEVDGVGREGRQPLPRLRLLGSTCLEPGAGGAQCGRRRARLRMTLPEPGYYGAMRLSGDLLAWSFTDKKWRAGAEERARVVRFCGADGSERWDFWADVGEGGRLRADVAAACLADEGSPAVAMAAQFPPWTSVTASHVTRLTWALEPLA